jgi:dsDNA-specific endonuclease/ATPase MutS2
VESSALSVLELPAVLERLARATATSRGAELARSLVPSPDAAEVAARQSLTAEAIALLDAAAEPPLVGIADLRAAAAGAARVDGLGAVSNGQAGAMNATGGRGVGAGVAVVGSA